MLNINYKEKYQMFYLKRGIKESLNGNMIKSIREDHFNGCNYINNIKMPLTFPMYILNYTNTISKKKELHYNFIGNITDSRQWVKKYSNNSVIRKSLYGRNSNTKYEIDKDYYNIMSKSKFTLTPTGDCPWSYRFFESIMCLSIPILENNSNDIYMKDYHYFFDKDEHIYDKEKAIENYNKFIKSKHFLKNIPELENLFKKTRK
tara:strand:- start:6 stop:617 length:612 start_codon:yes stop_codon:yes gene_type:complete